MSKLGKDIAINILFAGLNVASVWLLTRLSTDLLAPVALAIFMLVRRYSSSLSSFIHLGGPAFQIRYVGMHADDKPFGQLVGLVLCGVYSLTSIAVVGLAAIGGIARVFLPAQSYPPWVLWYVVILAVQQLFHFIVINHLLQRRRMVLYNVYKLLCASWLYVVALAVTHDAVRGVLAWYAIASTALLVAGHGLFTLPALAAVRSLPLERTRWILGELFTYGPPRSLINMFDSLLFVVGPWLIRDEVVQVGYLLTMFVFVQATSIVILPINELSMLLGAQAIGKNDIAPLEAGARSLFEGVIAVSVILVAAVYPYHQAVIALAIRKTEVLQGVGAYAALLTCIIPLSVYNGLKGLVEVRWKTPRNLGNLLVSNVLGVVTFYALARTSVSPIAPVVCACAATFWALGALTLLSAWPLVRHAEWRSLLVLLAVSGLSLATNMVIARVTHLPGPAQVALAGVTGAAVATGWWYAAKPTLLQTGLRALQRWLPSRLRTGS